MKTFFNIEEEHGPPAACKPAQQVQNSLEQNQYAIYLKQFRNETYRLLCISAFAMPVVIVYTKHNGLMEQVLSYQLTVYS